MMLKTISIVLPENMIREIDKILMAKDYSSRSDFFRYLFRFWQFQVKAGPLGTIMDDKGRDDKGRNDKGRIEMSDEERALFAKTDCEFGIPPEVIAVIEKKAKLIN